MKTIKLEDGKYVFCLNNDGLLVNAYRNGEVWPAGHGYAYEKAFMAALNRIVELEGERGKE